MSSFRLSLLLTHHLRSWRTACGQLSKEAMGTGKESSTQRLTWSRLSAQHAKARVFSTGAEGKLESDGGSSEDKNGGLQLSDSCIEVISPHNVP